jgi:predicted phosphodiesterase
MNIAVISDLHLGPGDRADRFGHDDLGFLEFLSFLEGNFERIILLGDIWETLTPHWPDPSKALRQARAAHPEIARRFERKQYTYIHGNHDIIAGPLEGAPEELALTVDGTRLLFTHGHHHDLLIRKARWISELAVWLGGWVLRLGFEWIYKVFDQFDQASCGASIDKTRCTFQRWAVGLASARNADVVVTGHTHIASKEEHSSTLYLNSGSCSHGHLSFLAMDTRAGNYAVHTGY